MINWNVFVTTIVLGVILVFSKAGLGVYGAGPSFLGCSYQPGDVWQQNIQDAPLDPNSSAYIQAVLDAPNGGTGFNVFVPDDEYINMATPQTPLVPVLPRVTYHTPYTPWPWQAGFYISSLSDGHAMVLQNKSCQYYEGYETSWDGSSLTQQNGGVWYLTQPFSRPQYGAISTASGIPIGFLAVRPEELAAGVINHALGWDAVAHTVSQTACVSPAGVKDCTDDLMYNGPGDDNPMPYGAHIRLKASFNISGFPREAQIVARALQVHGAYLYDTASVHTIPFIDDVNGSPVWTSQDGNAISGLTIGDFEVVQAPQ